MPAPRRRARHAAFVGPTRPSPARAPLAARRPEGTPRLPAPKAPAVPPGIAPVPRRPGKSPPASAPPKHIAAFLPRPPGSGTAAARAAAFRCAPKGDRILGLFRLETAAPSRVNFRKIQGWGY